MGFLRDALPGVLPPAFVAALLLAPLLWGGGRGSLAAALRVLALAGAFVAGQIVLFGVPPLPPPEAWQWLPWLALAGAAVAILGEVPAAVPAPLRGLLRLLTVAAAARLLVAPYLEWLGWEDGGALLRVGLLAVLWAGLWLAMDRLARRRPGPALPLAFTLAASATSILTLLAGGARLGQLGGVLATAAGVATAVSWLRPGLSWARGGMAVPVLLHGALVLLGWLALAPDLPGVAALLLGLAPLLAWAGEWRATGAEGRRMLPLLRRAALVAVPLLAAAWLVWLARDGGGSP